MVSVQHCGDLFILETSEEKRTELPDAVWKKLTIVCGIISYSRFPNFESLRIQYHLFDNLSWLQITGREEQFLFDEQFYSNPCSTERETGLGKYLFFYHFVYNAYSTRRFTPQYHSSWRENRWICTFIFHRYPRPKFPSNHPLKERTVMILETFLFCQIFFVVNYLWRDNK